MVFEIFSISILWTVLSIKYPVQVIFVCNSSSKLKVIKRTAIIIYNLLCFRPRDSLLSCHFEVQTEDHIWHCLSLWFSKFSSIKQENFKDFKFFCNGRWSKNMRRSFGQSAYSMKKLFSFKGVQVYMTIPRKPSSVWQFIIFIDIYTTAMAAILGLLLVVQEIYG